MGSGRPEFEESSRLPLPLAGGELNASSPQGLRLKINFKSTVIMVFIVQKTSIRLERLDTRTRMVIQICAEARI